MEKKYIINDMQEIAKLKNGKCLSSKYVNIDSKLEWECKEGHIWKATPYHIIHRGQWCPICAGKIKITIEYMKIIAKIHGGKCLSNKYINSNTKLKWECKKGHIWENTPSHIKNGQWCPKCSKNNREKKYTIDNMKKIAKRRGGKCLSKKYLGIHEYLEWKCDKGHRWKAWPSNIINGTWCPICAIENRASKQRFTIEDMQELAKKRGGKCLSDKYINGISKLKWQCSKGHTWEAQPISVNSGSWCSICVKNYKSNIKEMKNLAKERGGKCLSKKYINNHTSLVWQCSEGHVWKTQPSNVKSGNWCPECSIGIGERLCKIAFEQLLTTNFKKVKPKWLINYEGNLMELDGYSKKLNIAFEHQGRQHFEESNFYHKRNPLTNRKKDDLLKQKLCIKHGIILINVPEIPYKLKLIDVKSYIINELKRKGFNFFPKNIDKIKVNFKDAYTNKTKEILNNIKEVAKKRGGECLSKIYINNRTKLNFKCEKGHEWKSTSYSILSNNSWCPICAGNVPLTIEEMRKIAKEHGGECLSNQYINYTTKLKWKCNKGHIWESVPASIKSGTWCPICSNQNVSEVLKKSIKEMNELAKQKGGKCLSKKYINTHTKLKWKCNKGHIWEATPASINYSSWCPVCAGEKIGDLTRLSIKDMQKLAEKHGGNCLSKKYINDRNKLVWQCSKGHKWDAVPYSIKAGSWCPICAGKINITIKDMQKLAKEHGGKCLSEAYINNTTKLKWQCKKGHIWETKPTTIKNKKRWCPICGREKTIKSIKDTIENMQKIAKEREGRCISNEYINNNTKLKWQCSEGHTWESTPKNIKKGHWCLICKKNKQSEKNIIKNSKKNF